MKKYVCIPIIKMKKKKKKIFSLKKNKFIELTKTEMTSTLERRTS